MNKSTINHEWKQNVIFYVKLFLFLFCCFHKCHYLQSFHPLHILSSSFHSLYNLIIKKSVDDIFIMHRNQKCSSNNNFETAIALTRIKWQCTDAKIDWIIIFDDFLLISFNQFHFYWLWHFEDLGMHLRFMDRSYFRGNSL